MIPQAFDASVSREPAVRLTEREKEVLALIIEGNSSNVVAKLLFICRRTVDFHLAQVYSKLDVHNRLTAYHKAVRLGLITPCARLPRYIPRGLPL